MLPKCWKHGEILRDAEGNVVLKKRIHLDTEPDMNFL